MNALKKHESSYQNLDVATLLLTYMDVSELDIAIISIFPKNEQELQEMNSKAVIEKDQTIVSNNPIKVLSNVSNKF